MKRHAEVLCYKLQTFETLNELMSQYCRLKDDQLSEWLLFITYAKSFKEDLTVARKVYQKAFRFCQSKDEIARDWLQWETLFGDADAILKCKDQIKRKVQLQPEQKQVEPEK